MHVTAAWSHRACVHVSLPECRKLSSSNDLWYCPGCSLPAFAGDLFDLPVASSIQPSTVPTPVATGRSSGRGRKVTTFWYGNCRSIRNKVVDLQAHVSSLPPGSVALLTETWLDAADSELFDTNTYTVFQKDRCGRGRRVLSAFPASARIFRRTDLEHQDLEALFVEFCLPHSTVLVGCVYCPPSIREESYRLLEVSLRTASLRNYENILVFGDFNSHIDWFTHEDPVPRDRSDDFLLDTASSAGLTQACTGSAYSTRDGTSSFLDLLFVADPTRIVSYVSLVIWAALGGSGADSEALRKMAAQRRYRVEFADNAARWLQQYGYDGLVLHWRQPMAGQDRGMLSALVRTLKRRLAEDALRLGIVLPADKERRTAGYDVREVAQVADVLFVDTHRTMDPASFPVTSFFSPLRAKSQAKKLRQTGLSYVLGDLSLEVAQMDKLVFSLTLAGASFTLRAAENNKVGDPAAGPGHPGVFTKQPGVVSYYEIEQMLAHDLSWSRQFDRVSQCPFIVNGDQWIGFEDDVSLQSKAHLLLFTGGMALWDICMDDFRATFGRPLLARARDILLRNHSYGRSGRTKRRH
ncbi:hypothetical protein ISCGN_009236 [Ixodes scapularis]